MENPVKPAESGEHSTKVALAMFSLLLLAYVVNAMDRQLFSVLAKDVREALKLTLPQVGLASTLFTLGMGVAGIPTGWLLSKMSRKNVSLLGLVIFSVATWLTGHSTGLYDLMAYRFISGLGEAMQLTAILAIGTTYFLKNRGVAASSLNFTFGIGAILGPNLGAAILNSMGWQAPFTMFGLLGVPTFILILLFVKPWFSEVKSQGQTAVVVDESDAADSIWARTPVILAIATAFAGLSIYGYLGLYPTFLRDALGFAPKQAALSISCYGFGALLSLFGGWLGDRFDYRKLLFIALVISAITGGLLFTELGRSLEMHMFFSFIFGSAISGMVYSNLSAGIIKSVKRAKASEASGLFVAAIYIPAAFAGYLLGALKGSFGWTPAAIMQISGCALIAAILSIMAAKKK